MTAEEADTRKQDTESKFSRKVLREEEKLRKRNEKAAKQQ